jgi:mono/diheme cytochrome c family protein
MAFATGFEGSAAVSSPESARYRPTGLAEGSDGSVYIADSVQGRIWRISYTGVSVHRPASVPEPKTPENSTTSSELAGTQNYQIYCASCHMSDGGGVSRFQPSLIDSPIVNGDTDDLIRLVLDGKATDTYANRMPSFAYLKDETIAELLNYIRSKFGNQSAQISGEDIETIRRTLN